MASKRLTYTAKNPPLRANSDDELAGPDILVVNVQRAADVDPALEEAVGFVVKAATRLRAGIMITRVGVGRYVVRAALEVPHGLTRQEYRKVM
ncbi:hypothetical protein KNN17_21515 [Arthrobacter bambusae]|uniref:hypothetical protein n=1 Tax=Arthrobacter bambusae TaxID=1338426 RepID=UPI001F5149B5|nr:hypothetical protein [Arthrobacter bambusae]MCI0144130.1 hypothetical protein [Arthrobacter bambusae]